MRKRTGLKYVTPLLFILCVGVVSATVELALKADTFVPEDNPYNPPKYFDGEDDLWFAHYSGDSSHVLLSFSPYELEQHGWNTASSATLTLTKKAERLEGSERFDIEVRRLYGRPNGPYGITNFPGSGFSTRTNICRMDGETYIGICWANRPQLAGDYSTPSDTQTVNQYTNTVEFDVTSIVNSYITEADNTQRVEFYLTTTNPSGIDGGYAMDDISFYSRESGNSGKPKLEVNWNDGPGGSPLLMKESTSITADPSLPSELEKESVIAEPEPEPVVTVVEPTPTYTTSRYSRYSSYNRYNTHCRTTTYYGRTYTICR